MTKQYPEIEKPWGTTRLVDRTPFFEVHAIRILGMGSHCSWHHHTAKHNGFFVLSGRLAIERRAGGQKGLSVLEAGEYLSVGPGLEHRMVGCADVTEALEFYHPEILGEDIVRHSTGGRGWPADFLRPKDS